MMDINSFEVKKSNEVYVELLRERLYEVIQKELDNLEEEDLERIIKYKKKVIKAFRKSLEYFELITNTYHIQDIGDEPLVVWKNKLGDKVEYLNKNGVWRANYLKANYCEVECSVKGIFNLLNAELLVAQNLVEDKELGEYLPKARLARQFINFVDNTRKIATGQVLPR